MNGEPRYIDEADLAEHEGHGLTVDNGGDGPFLWCFTCENNVDGTPLRVLKRGWVERRMSRVGEPATVDPWPSCPECGRKAGESHERACSRLGIVK